MREPPAIELDAVGKSYDGGRSWAVDEVTLHVPPGSLVVLLGPSGCGKTTILRMVNRLSDATRGRVAIGGADVRSLDRVALRRSIGYVVQAIGLFPHMTVAENVGLVPSLLGWDRPAIDERVRELLELVRLDPATYAGRLPRELSGGQRQRVGFARALAARPRVMLLDEPFGALDPVTRDDLQREYLDLQRSLGLTTLMVTHDMTEALLMGDRIAVIAGGRIVRLGSPRELLAEPGDPFVARLMETPRRQADRLEAMAHAPGDGASGGATT